MNKEDRIKYYFGDYFNKTIEIVIDKKYYEFKQDQIYFYRGPEYYLLNNTLSTEHGILYPYFYWDENIFNINIPCLSISGDGYDNNNLPVLMKTRLINSKNKGILLNVQYDRHWGSLKLPLNNTLWKDKINEPVWRGNHITGLFKTPNRRQLVEKYNKKFNFKFYSNNHIDNYSIKNNKLFDSNIMNIEEQLKYKFIIMMEGNDKASGLNWALKSNSLLLMPKPSVESWLMEGLLIPWQHYIPLDDSLEDIEEKISWCCKNDEICHQISRNSSEYMKQFSDIETEKTIHSYIIKEYQKNIKLIL
jgi:hypothetical protein